MAITQNNFTGDGSTVLFSFTFPYLDESHIKVSLNGSDTTAYTLANATTIQFTTAPANGVAIRIFRQTDDSSLQSTFYSGSAIRSQDLNDNFTQNLYVTQEVNNNVVDIDGTNPMVGNFNAGNFKVINLASPTADTDAVNRGYVNGIVANGIGDGDKGDIVVSGSGSVLSIDAGVIVDADVNASAGIVSSKLAFLQSGTAATTRTVDSKLKDIVSVKDFGAVGNGVTDDTAAIQAAIDTAYLAGGGEVNFPEGTFLVSATIFVPQRVTLVGKGSGFVNQYSSNYAAPKGTVLFLKTGSNVSVVLFRCRLTNNGGVLEETTLGGRNVDIRHFGGMRGITIWGNRSLNQSPAIRDLNTAGFGVVIEGSRYVRIEDTVIMYCAESGLSQTSYDYGTGSISTNNTQLSRVSSLSNYGDGFRLFGGDSIFSNLNAGANNGSGIVTACSGTMTGGLAWNNHGNGFIATGNTSTSSTVISGLHSYDNDQCGFRLGGGRVPHLSGCVARGNGRDTGAAALERSNYLISATAEGWHLPGCSSYGRAQDGALVTQYGFYIDNVSYSGTIDGTSDELSATPYFIVNNNQIITHGAVTTTIPHPPIKLLGHIDMDGWHLGNTSSLLFNGWLTLNSITGGVIPVTTNSLITINLGAPTNITDISFSGTDGLPFIIVRNISASAATFVHNTAKLRLANATNAVLNTNEAIMFVYVSGTIWQQVAVAS